MSKRTNMFRKKKLFLVDCLLFTIFILAGCNNKTEQKNTAKTIDYIKPIPGESDCIPAGVAAKGEVLIAYSDCYTCHTKNQRSKGPSFEDIAKRYPVNKIYIGMLAQKVIVGGSRSWGYPVMDPHPELSVEDARLMVTYILSLKK